MTFSTRIFLVILLGAFFASAAVLYAEELQLNEQQLKAAFVFNIARYVTWPTTPHESQLFTVGVIGQGRNSSSLGSLQGKTIHGRKIVVQSITDLDEVTNCQLVFIETSERKNIYRILSTLKDYPVLAISEIDGFSQYGGIITLRVVSNRMTFEVNLKSARASGLIISSNLLKLATEVIK